MIVVVREPARAAAEVDRGVLVAYDLPHAEVRRRLETALSAHRDGVVAEDLTALDASCLREAVLASLFGAESLQGTFVGEVDGGRPQPDKAGLQRRLEELGTIHGLTEAVARAKTPERIYEEALDALQALVNVDRAAVLLWDTDGVIRFKASRGLSAAYQTAVTGHSPWSPSQVDAEPMFVEDVAAEPSLASLLPTFAAEDIRALGFVPIAGQGRLLGKFMLYSARPRRFTFAEVDVARTIGCHIGFALERMRHEADLQAANAQLTIAGDEAMAATRARDAFLARASHELRTPLTSLVGALRLLKQAMAGTSRERPEQLLELANRNLDVMLALVNDLLDASKLSAEPAVPGGARVQLRHVITQSAEIVEPQAREKDVRLEIQVRPDIVARGDADKLEQVFVNLLANAVRHSDPSGLIVVEATAEAQVVTVRVQDHGEGIAAEELERIFEPFVRLSRSRQTSKRGTGLGLAICRQIVTLHEGRIWAESEGPGRGSVFVVSLPAPKPDERAA